MKNSIISKIIIRRAGGGGGLEPAQELNISLPFLEDSFVNIDTSTQVCFSVVYQQKKVHLN